MLKETLSSLFNIQSKTVNNAIIQLGDTDDSGKGKHFKSRFVQPGIAGYPERDENLLITKESFDRFIHTLKNKPVIINHKDEITEDDKVGEVHNVWYNPDDGWYWCDGVISDKYAMDLIKKHKWSVSCSYDILKADDEGGSENNIKYGMEILDGEFKHLAIVKNPRYERANIVFNSKTQIINKKVEPVSDSSCEDDDMQGRGQSLINDSAMILQEIKKLVNIKNDAEFESKHPRDEQGRFTNIPTDNNGYSLKLIKSQRESINMGKAMSKGFYPEEQVKITLSGATKAGKELKKLFDENKKYKTNFRINYAHKDNNLNDWIWDDEVGDLAPSAKPVYFDTEEEANEWIKKQGENIVNPKVKQVEEWHHISGGGRNKLIDINDLVKLGFKVDTSTANKEFKLADNNINPNYQEELKQVIDKAKNNPNERQKLVIGKVTDNLVKEAKENGFDIADYNHDLDVSGIRHAFKEHGTEKTEIPRGQIPIEDSDFEKIPEVIYEADEIKFTGKNKTGLETITYKKTMPDNIVFYVEEIRTGQKTLTINTMYKHKNTDDPRTSANNSNPLSNVSIYIIPPSDTNLNPNVKNNKETFEEALQNGLSEIIKNCKPETEEDLKILKGLKDILEEQ